MSETTLTGAPPDPAAVTAAGTARGRPAPTAPGRVAVIGNGPVGQTTALLLARWGVPVVLLDARPERDPIGSKSICQQRDVLDVWESVGAGERIAGEGVTWTTARTFYRDQELFAYTLPDPGRSPFPPFVNISQARTEAVLDERIAGEPLIDVQWDREVVGVTQDADGLVLTCRTSDGRVEITADYAVACTGARGEEMRALLGVTFDGRSFDDLFLICDIRADLPGWVTERRFYFDPSWNPGRQVLIHPCPGSTFRIDWQVPGDYDLDAEEASGRLDERIRTVIGDRPYEIIWKSVYRFHARAVDRMRIGRILLAGDSAHLVAPFGARGLNTGVWDAENAAWKLAFVLHGWAGAELLDSYHDERHAATRENLEITSATMRFLVPRDEEQRRARTEILARALADPAGTAEVDSGRLSEPFWYVDSPLTTACPARPFAGRPPRGSVPPAGPGILVPDAPIVIDGGTRTRIRSVSREAFLLLATPGIDVAATHRAAAQVVDGPVRVLALADIDVTGALAEAIEARPAELWIIRPDAHVAAVLTAPGDADVAAALRRVLGRGDHAPGSHPRESRAQGGHGQEGPAQVMNIDTHTGLTRKAVDDGVLPAGR